MAGALYAQLLTRAVEPADVPVARGVFGGPAGEVWANLCDDRMGYVAYSSERYGQFVMNVAAGAENLRLDIGVVVPKPVPQAVLEAGVDLSEAYALGALNLSLSFVRDGEGVGWLSLGAHPSLFAPDAPGENALVGMIDTVVDQFPVAYGRVEIDWPPVGRADGPAHWERRTWIAVLDRSMVDGHGGPDGLRVSGLFADVRRAAAGGYVVKTRPHLQDILTAAAADADRWLATA